MNKSLATNLLAALIIFSGYFSSWHREQILSIGCFALSGAVTNWLAVHMLFEKVPFLYGSGIIPNRVEEFKSGIKKLIMVQFFSEENLEKFFKNNINGSGNIKIEEISNSINYEKIILFGGAANLKRLAESLRKELDIDVELGNALRSKDELLVKGAYERNGELHLGYSGTLKVTEKAGFSPLDGLEDGQNVHLRGFVAKMEGQDSFVKGTDTVQGFSFMLSDGKSERRCVMLGGLERAGKLEEGDDVIIENGTVRNGNVEIDSDVRVLSRRARDMLIGELSMLECEGEKLLAKVGEKEVALDRLNALRFLGVQAADDIDLCTVVNLKKDALINNRMAVRIQQREGQIIIR